MWGSCWTVGLAVCRIHCHGHAQCCYVDRLTCRGTVGLCQCWRGEKGWGSRQNDWYTQSLKAQSLWRKERQQVRLYSKEWELQRQDVSFNLFVNPNIRLINGYVQKSWETHFVLIYNFLSSCVSKSSLPSCLPSQTGWKTSRLSGWRRRICSIGGFLCAPMPPPHPKSTPAPSPGTCLMEKTTTSTTSAQVKRPRVQMWLWNVNTTKHDFPVSVKWWLYLLHLYQQTSYLHISCF